MPKSNKGKKCICENCGEKYIYGEGNIRRHSLTKCYDCIYEYNRERIKRKCINYKGGECIICGYNKCLASLCFHHISPDKKDFEISSAFLKSWANIQKELDKCILLCGNCHGELHAGLIILSEENICLKNV